jgi:hypothetical protein
MAVLFFMAVSVITVSLEQVHNTTSSIEEEKRKQRRTSGLKESKIL